MNWKTVGGWVFGGVCALWLLFSPVAVLMALFAPRMATAGAGPGATILAWTFFTWPVATILAPVAAGIQRGKERRVWGWALLALPMLWLLPPLVIWGGLAPDSIWSSR